MCIFCERARASLDDPLAGGEWHDDDAYNSSPANTNNTRSATATWQASLNQKREAERCEQLKRQARLPVTVVTGFLGAGKTTFVNHILLERHGRRLAVIENEFGEVAVDDALLGEGGVERADEAQQVILMPNGCMCCRVRGDLVDALKRLIASSHSSSVPTDNLNSAVVAADVGDATSNLLELGSSNSVRDGTSIENAAGLDGIVLECSGLDELAPVLQTFFADAFVQQHVRLDAVVCLCDSPRLLRLLVPESAESLTPSPDNYTATRDEGASNGYMASGTSVAPYGRANTNTASDSSSALVMSQLALADRVLLNKSDLISPDEGKALIAAVKSQFPGVSAIPCERGKVDVKTVLGVDSFSLDRALEMDEHFADLLADARSNARLKHEQAHREADNDGRTEQASKNHRHGHDRMGAQSVGVEIDSGPIEWAKFKAWLKTFLQTEGEVIWRLKGVLWTRAPGTVTHGNGRSERTVIQGLYGHFESEVSDWPTRATRRSRVVFIGELDERTQEALRQGVRSCVAPPKPRPPPPPYRPQRESPLGTNFGGGFASRLGSVKFGDDSSMFL